MSDAPILICFDGSEEARHAMRAAAELLGPRRAVVLAVGPIITSAESFALTSSLVPGSAFEDVNRADALARARDGAAYAADLGFEATARAEIASDTWAGIVDAAAELDSPLIVIGTRALTGLRRLHEGSVSEDVVRYAERPVLVVPPARERRGSEAPT
jgi:nucleotide-binding universal stress UspA family protein